MRKKYEIFFFAIHTVTGERSRIRSRIRIRIHNSEVPYGSGDPDSHQNVTDLQHCCTMCMYYSSSSLPGRGRFIDWAFNVKYMKMHTVWVWAILKITISWESILLVVLYAVKCIYVTIFYFRVVLEENWPIMLEGDDIYESLGTLQTF